MHPRILLTCLAWAALGEGTGARGEVRYVQKSFPSLPGAALKVECYRGSIEVRVSPDTAFHIEIALDPGTERKDLSEQLLRKVETKVTADGPVVSISVRNPSESGWHLDLNEGPRMSVDCRCLVPRTCDLDLATAEGSVNVGDLSGRIKVRGKSGTVFFRHINGSIEAVEDHGDIIVSHCTGPATLKSLLGGIRAGTIGGRVEARTTNGDIEVQHALGGGLLSTTAGEITLGLPKELSREVRAETDGGGILLRIDPAAHCAIQASSVWGKVRVRTMVPIATQSGGNGRSSLTGTLNGGGPTVTLHANGGHIRIEPLGG